MVRIIDCPDMTSCNVPDPVFSDLQFPTEQSGRRGPELLQGDGPDPQGIPRV